MDIVKPGWLEGEGKDTCPPEFRQTELRERAGKASACADGQDSTH